MTLRYIIDKSIIDIDNNIDIIRRTQVKNITDVNA